MSSGLDLRKTMAARHADGAARARPRADLPSRAWAWCLAAAVLVAPVPLVADVHAAPVDADGDETDETATADGDGETDAETDTDEAGADIDGETDEPEPEPEPKPKASVPVVPPPKVVTAAPTIRVAVGLAPEAPGSKAERTIVDELETSVRASTSPKTDVRRLRAGSAEARVVCREGRDDLIIVVGYLPDQANPALFTHDCLIDEPLGVRSAEAAADPEFAGVLWAEHQHRLRQGAKERRRTRINPKVRTALIVGSAVAVLGVAVGFLIAGALRRDTVVLKVEPQ